MNNLTGKQVEDLTNEIHAELLGDESLKPAMEFKSWYSIRHAISLYMKKDDKKETCQ